MSGVELVFWLSLAGVFYPYFGYPLLLWVLRAVVPARTIAAAADADLPSVTLIIPVHNEQARVGDKLTNTAALRYPQDRLQILLVSDGSTDRTVDIIRERPLPGAALIELPGRSGKAAALNAGLARASHEILVFTDTSIQLGAEALEQIVRQFADPAIGCVSGEDPIVGGGGEALYGRYELTLRRLESSVHSIVGASGSFYAQRRHLCQPFVEGMAPDFLSVLRTVEQGFRAVSEPLAVGTMTSVKDPRQEFERKVRTVLRGMTTLFGYGHLLNPLRTGIFAFELWSHKVMRWLAPLFMLGALGSALALVAHPFYAVALAAQLLLYVAALAAFRHWAGLQASLLGKVALYFTSVNLAILAGWWRYGRGVRQEIWTPSNR
ncbi:MAG: glycosyltransferase family 2 protein [Acidobacteriota bacterium]